MKNIYRLNIVVVLLLILNIAFSQNVVVCVGNSITAGYGIADPNKYYPAQLQDSLASGWIVKNCGLSGTTLLKKGNKPYWDQTVFTLAKAYAPNVVIIKLGSNDSKPINWANPIWSPASAVKDTFVANYTELINVFKTLPTKPLVYICLPAPPYNNNFTIDSSVIKNDIIPLIKTIATQNNVGLIDLNTPLLYHPEWFSDGIHPNVAGLSEIARVVKSVLTNENYPKLSVSSDLLVVDAQEKSTAKFIITSNSSWNVSSDQNWLTVSDTVGSNNAILTLVAQANGKDSIRTASITIMCSGVASKIITVQQNGTSSRRFTAIAHRGASSLAPENTIAAFKRAIDLGADYFELDVRTTIDDSLIIMHDDNVNRTTNGTGSISSKTYAQIRSLDAGSKFSSAFDGEKVPSLYETLKLARDFNSKICIEIKSASVAKVIDLIQKMNMQKRVIIFSFNFDDLKASKSIDSTIAVLYLVASTQGSEAFQVKNIKGEYLGVGSSMPSIIYDFARLSGVKLWIWTVDDINGMKSEFEKGMDGIITNYPQLLVPLRDSLNTTSVRKEQVIPNEFVLSQNYPNPFNPTTSIKFGVPQSSIVKIMVYDIIGREVATLVNENYSPGFYTVPFNAGKFASGVYIYRMTSHASNGDQKLFTNTKKLLLMK